MAKLITDLKEGDQVVLHHYNITDSVEPYEKAIVSKVTKTTIKIGDKTFNRRNGRRWGEGDYWSTSVDIAQDDAWLSVMSYDKADKKNAEWRIKHKHRMLVRKVGKIPFGQLKTETLEQIITLAESELPAEQIKGLLS